MAMIASVSLCSTDFQYSPLDSKPRTIRLIQLLPPVRSLFPPFGKLARIQIIERSLDEDDTNTNTTPFDTLSYTWGDIGRSKPSQPILVETPAGQRILKIYPSLEQALLSLAARKQQGLVGPVEHPLFVDQICINQDDGAEKTSQVRLMGAIYARCARVVVWLGPSTRQSDEVFAFAEDVCGAEGAALGRVMLGPKNAARFPKVYEAVVYPDFKLDGSDGDAEAEAVRRDRDDLLRLVRRYGPRYPLRGVADLLGRPWFSRLWVIQECCLAPDVVFVCGLRSLCFDCMRAVMLFYTIWNKERKALHVNGTRMSLYELVLKYSVIGDDNIRVGATLPEDRIYGLLGLARDEEVKRNTAVVYDGPWKVYTRFAASVVQNDLDILLYSQKGKSVTNLPSWVPDWSAAHLSLPCGYSDARTPIFSAGGKTINQPPVVDQSQGLLTVQGYFVDRVSLVGTQGVQRDGTGDNPIEKVDFVSAARFFDEINEFLEAAGNLEQPRFPYASDQHLRDAATVHLADGGLSSRQFSAQFDPAAAQALLEKIHAHTQQSGHAIINAERTAQSYSITHIIRTVGIYAFVTDMIGFVRVSSRVQLTAWYLRMRQRYFTKVDMGGDGPRKLLEQMGIDSLRPWEQYTSNLYKTIGRRLFMTGRGYLGLGPEDMEKGDVIVVLVGSSTPHVLRRSVAANSSEYWSYVGEAFCEGIMDGEILREKGVGEVTDFHIL